MKREFLDILCCPSCKWELYLSQTVEEAGEIREGLLSCDRCRLQYPIRNFIPRFVKSDSYANAFTWEWTVFQRAQLDSYTGLRISDRDFRNSFNFPVEELSGKCVLDAGCGKGRFAEIALNYGATVVCLDLSFAVDVAFKNLNHRGNIFFVQGSIFEPPLKKEVFDVIYSLGVLHHTPDPRGAFFSLIPLLKKGGRISVRVYARYNKAYIATTEFYRRLTKRMPKRVLLWLCYVAIPLYYVHKIPVLGPFITRILLPVSVTPPTHEWRVCNTFDLYSPLYTHFFDHYEVFHWFKTAGLTDVEPVNPDGGVCYIGIK